MFAMGEWWVDVVQRGAGQGADGEATCRLGVSVKGTRICHMLKLKIVLDTQISSLRKSSQTDALLQIAKHQSSKNLDKAVWMIS